MMNFQATLPGGTPTGSSVGRFSACGDPALEERVARDLDVCVRRALQALPRALVEGVVLGGGYGRGEGGARFEGGRLVPYNDYDLFVITGVVPWLVRNELERRMHAVGRELTERLGVEVEFAVLTRAQILEPPPSLAMADLRSGHRVLFGPPDLLHDMPGPRVEDIDLVEATLLIMNRSALLVMARDLLSRLHEPEAAERAARYVRKAWLAAGDSRLIALGRYHSSWEERVRRVGEAQMAPWVRERYVLAVRERLTGAPAPEPTRLAGSFAEAARELGRALDEVERVRLGVGTTQRARYRRTVLAQMPARWRDRLRDLRDCGTMALTLPLQGGRTARVLAVLPCVLDHLADPDIQHHPCAWLEPARILGVGPATVEELDASFLRRWGALP